MGNSYAAAAATAGSAREYTQLCAIAVAPVERHRCITRNKRAGRFPPAGSRKDLLVAIDRQVVGEMRGHYAALNSRRMDSHLMYSWLLDFEVMDPRCRGCVVVHLHLD